MTPINIDCPHNGNHTHTIHPQLLELYEKHFKHSLKSIKTAQSLYHITLCFLEDITTNLIEPKDGPKQEADEAQALPSLSEPARVQGDNETMKIIGKNENGDALALLAQKGSKIITRQLEKLPIGSIQTIEDDNGAILCNIQITACQTHDEWLAGWDGDDLAAEAAAEGFQEYSNMVAFYNNNVPFDDAYRIAFTTQIPQNENAPQTRRH